MSKVVLKFKTRNIFILSVFSCSLHNKGTGIFSHFYIVQLKNIDRIVRISTIGIIIYLFAFGIAMAFFPIRPFWNDEWRLIYNIKFKDINQLWGTLDLLQECPRAYLTLIKLISSAFDYSYTALRLPSLVIGFFSILFLFYLRRKLYPGNSVFSYLFILILVSSQAFTDYLVQVKHYEMDIFLCLVALWQLLVLLKISRTGVADKSEYILLYLTFLLLPYFSYIYPITVAPIFVVILIRAITQQEHGNQRRFLWTIYMPLLIVATGIAIFYFIDVKNLMADKRMYVSYLQVYYKGEKPNFLLDFWNLFALVGSGFIFEIIFGVLGIASFFYGIYRLVKTKVETFTNQDYLRLYAVLLLLLVLFLFLTGKLIGGVARLTVYSVPSISILIISLLEDIKAKYNYVKLANTIAGILFLGLFGNIISSCINNFTYFEYSNRIRTYRNTEQALREARVNRIPFLVTEEINGDPVDLDPPIPGVIRNNTIDAKQIAGADTLAGEVIVKVNPGYKVWDTIPVYMIPDTKWAQEYVKQLPVEYQSAIVGDGINYRKINR
jgi:hypothetical protein